MITAIFKMGCLEGKDKWLNAVENAKELEDGEVAVYALINKARKETKTLLHPNGK